MRGEKQKAIEKVRGQFFILLEHSSDAQRSRTKILFDKDELQRRVLNVLHSFHGSSSSSGSSSWRGIVTYTAGMAVWEFFGMATIPVETAAGMVFGFRLAFVTSAVGKLLGALLAYYALGQTLFQPQTSMGRKLRQNRVPTLVNDHIQRNNPFRVALLLLYSLLPELVKNCGAALFEPIRPWMFGLSIVLHVRRCRHGTTIGNGGGNNDDEYCYCRLVCIVAGESNGTIRRRVGNARGDGIDAHYYGMVGT